MLLSEKDIKRLEARGYRKTEFVHFDRQGYATLKNRNGYCIFYDSVKRQCSVYDFRPSGCRVYPVIVDEEQGVVLDTICESRGSITQQEKHLKGKRVVRLLKVIDLEASKRRFEKSI
jgi:Fe-S-cluster containining protein